MEENDIFNKDLLKETKRPRKKHWLIILIIIGISSIIVYGYIITNDPFENNTNNMSFEQFACSQIKVTPTWANKAGIVDEGFTNFENSNPKDAVDLLINAQVYFIYDSGNNDCKNQIGYFGTEWEKYVKSGYTINCKDV